MHVNKELELGSFRTFPGSHRNVGAAQQSSARSRYCCFTIMLCFFCILALNLRSSDGHWLQDRQTNVTWTKSCFFATNIFHLCNYFTSTQSQEQHVAELRFWVYDRGPQERSDQQRHHLSEHQSGGNVFLFILSFEVYFFNECSWIPIWSPQIQLLYSTVLYPHHVLTYFLFFIFAYSARRVTCQYSCSRN